MAYQYRIQDDQFFIIEVDKEVDNITVFRLFSEARDALANYYRAQRDDYRERVAAALALRTEDVIADPEPPLPSGTYQPGYSPGY